MLNLDPAKLLVIFVIALVVLGPERLPKVARQMAAVWRELSRIRDQVTDEVRQAIPDVDLPHLPSPSGAISNLLGDLRRPTASTSAATKASVKTDTAEDGETTQFAPSTPRRAPRVVVHPALGDMAFPPDDPSMN